MNDSPDATMDHEAEEKLALQRILALGEREIEAGKLTPIDEVGSAPPLLRNPPTE